MCFLMKTWKILGNTLVFPRLRPIACGNAYVLKMCFFVFPRHPVSVAVFPCSSPPCFALWQTWRLVTRRRMHWQILIRLQVALRGQPCSQRLPVRKILRRKVQSLPVWQGKMRQMASSLPTGSRLRRRSRLARCQWHLRELTLVRQAAMLWRWSVGAAAWRWILTMHWKIQNFDQSFVGPVGVVMRVTRSSPDTVSNWQVCWQKLRRLPFLRKPKQSARTRVIVACRMVTQEDCWNRRWSSHRGRTAKDSTGSFNRSVTGSFEDTMWRT